MEAKNVEKLTFNEGKLTISEAAPFEGFHYPSVLVNLQDVGFSFTIKFMSEHLDLFWHSTGKNTKDSHGIIGELVSPGDSVMIFNHYGMFIMQVNFSGRGLRLTRPVRS